MSDFKRKGGIILPDITMCDKKICPKKEECYRFKAIPSIGQTISDFENICNEEDGYKMFMPIKVKKY